MLKTARLLAISDRAALPGDLAVWIRELAAAGVDALQIREKDLEDRDLYGLTRLARSLLPPGTLLLVNGRVDVALAAGANGAHLPADGVPLAPLRHRFGTGVILGRSTHSVPEVEQAMRDGADHVTFGPVYPTPSKERFGPPVGLDALARAAAVGIPVYALGGVTLERFEEVALAGAKGVAGIRLFQNPQTLPEVVRAARELFPREP
ncbi:MAG TPA: thiamine phosphate synthase [Thermoanaerobaculia bacterium]|nr:thiamine phosphate synthase [Thermoanaerobaculia bacterium]